MTIRCGELFSKQYLGNLFQAFTPQTHFELQVQVEGQLLKGYKDDIICGSMGKLLL